ncbi:MAG: hypothetical protein HYU36_08145 [Planctomycetes bacterium]|nr:hypothetical protein [Planctomycetota bacterium]
MRSIREALWLWGTKVNGLESMGFPPSRMSVARGLQALRLDQAMMCGFLPPAEEEYAPVSHCRKLLWEMSFEPNFAFERPMSPIVELHRRHPNVTGVLLDDFSSIEIKKGARPEVLARMREALPPSLQLWIVVYSMNLGISNLPDYLRHVDGISFWVWHAKDLPRIAEWVARCRDLAGPKPMIAGLYFYDFGDGKPLTADAMAQQVDSGVELVRSGHCEGLCLLGSSIMDIGLEAVDWTLGWVERNGDAAV